MRGYGQFCPVAKAAEVFAERWTPLVVRELLQGSARFNEVHRGVPLMSRTLLARRLQALQRAGVVHRTDGPGSRGGEYRLTPAGEALRPVVEMLAAWGDRWGLGDVKPGDLDPGLLAWALRRAIDVTAVPAPRVVIRFDFRGVPERDRRRATWWLVVTRSGVDVCQKHPGFDEDLVVDADLAALTRVVRGFLGYRDALRAGLVALQGPRALVEGFPRWLGLPGAARGPLPFAAVRPSWLGGGAGPPAGSTAGAGSRSLVAAGGRGTHGPREGR
jgi:DNA-binding HxlR family transcriptional regulator